MTARRENHEGAPRQGGQAMEGNIDIALLRGMTQRRVSRRDIFRYAGAGAGAAGLSALLAACGVGGTGDGGDQQQAATIWDKAKKEGELNFANWPLYIDEGKNSTLPRFQKQTGIKVNYKTVINDNDAFLAKIIPQLQAGQDTGYDIIVITNGGPVERMIKLGFLIPLDHSYLKNFDRYASAAVKDPSYDPGNKHSVAWQSGFTGIAYNSEVVKTPPKTFQDLMNPAYKGRIGMFGNNQDLPCPALLSLGYDIQESTPDQWREAADLLQEQQPLVRSYYDQSYIKALANEEVVMTQAWSGDVFYYAAPKSEGGKGFSQLKFTLPEEGGVLWTDNMCIPQGAQHPVDAITMMDFVYRPTIAANIASWVWYVSPVPAAKDVVLNKLDYPLVGNSPMVFPNPDQLAQAHTYKVFENAEEEQEWNSIFQPIYTS